MKPIQIVILVAVAAMLVYFGVSLASNASTYAHFESAKRSGKTVHIAGEWVKRENVVEEPNKFQFFVQDSLKYTERVTYFDPKPNNFDQAEKVVLIGRYQPKDGFVADKIVTKCPSKYEETEITLGE